MNALGCGIPTSLYPLFRSPPVGCMGGGPFTHSAPRFSLTKLGNHATKLFSREDVENPRTSLFFSLPRIPVAGGPATMPIVLESLETNPLRYMCPWGTPSHFFLSLRRYSKQPWNPPNNLNNIISPPPPTVFRSITLNKTGACLKWRCLCVRRPFFFCRR